MAALLAGQAINDVATQYHVPATTIRSWKSRQSGDSVATVATDKKAQIGELLLDYLAAALSALRAQTDVFADKEWLKKQPANELAVLHGVVTDKTIRLLEALSRADDETN